MENASKALIMAGSILIALMTIGALMFMFDNISEVERQKNRNSETDAITKFNSEYEVYDAIGLRGSDLLSLINKIYDFNNSYLIDEGYQIIEISISFNNQMPDIDTALTGTIEDINTLNTWKEANLNNDKGKEFKRRYFKCIGIEYYESGRIKSLSFEEIKTTS